MDRDVDMIRIVERGSAAGECGIVEVPLGRSQLPNQLRKLAPVFFVAGAAALRGEIELIPPLKFSLWRQWHSAGLLTADQITAYRDHGLAALRPERREDVGGPRSPIEAGEDRLLDLESVQKVLEINGECRGLTVPDRRIRRKSRGAVAAQVRNDHLVSRRCQQRSDVNEAVDVIGPTMQ